MWIKTVEGDLYSADGLDNVHLSGPYLTRDQYVAWMGDMFTDLRSKPPRSTMVAVPYNERLWAVLAKPKASPREILIGYGLNEVAVKLREAVVNAIRDRAEFFDAGEFVVSVGGPAYPAEHGDRIDITCLFNSKDGESADGF